MLWRLAACRFKLCQLKYVATMANAIYAATIVPDSWKRGPMGFDQGTSEGRKKIRN